MGMAFAIQRMNADLMHALAQMAATAATTVLAGGQPSPVGMILETHATGLANGMTTYRLYVTFDDPQDALTAVMGKEGEALRIETTTSFLQADGEVFDSYVALDQSNIVVQGDQAGLTAFEAGQNLVWDTPVGGGWMASDLQGIQARRPPCVGGPVDH